MSQPTPCIGICKLDEDGFCLGCFRTAGEIGRWREMAEEECLAVMAKLQERRTS